MCGRAKFHFDDSIHGYSTSSISSNDGMNSHLDYYCQQEGESENVIQNGWFSLSCLFYHPCLPEYHHQWWCDAQCRWTDKVSVPRSITMNLTFHEHVTLYNISYLQELVQNNLTVHHGVRYVVHSTGKWIYWGTTSMLMLVCSMVGLWSITLRIESECWISHPAFNCINNMLFSSYVPTQPTTLSA